MYQNVLNRACQYPLLAGARAANKKVGHFDVTVFERNAGSLSLR